MGYLPCNCRLVARIMMCSCTCLLMSVLHASGPHVFKTSDPALISLTVLHFALVLQVVAGKQA